VCAAEVDLRLRRGELDRVARWRRRGARDLVAHASERLAAAEARLEDTARVAVPYMERVRAAETSVQQAHHEATVARIRDRLDNLSLRPPARAVERDLGVDLPGM
jgi:hypothetical protein